MRDRRSLRTTDLDLKKSASYALPAEVQVSFHHIYIYILIYLLYCIIFVRFFNYVFTNFALIFLLLIFAQ